MKTCFQIAECSLSHAKIALLSLTACKKPYIFFITQARPRPSCPTPCGLPAACKYSTKIRPRPRRFTPRAGLRCKTAHIGLRNGTFQVLKRAVLPSKTARSATRCQPGSYTTRRKPPHFNTVNVKRASKINNHKIHRQAPPAPILPTIRPRRDSGNAPHGLSRGGFQRRMTAFASFF